MRTFFFDGFLPDTTPAVFLSPRLISPLQEPVEGYSHTSGFHPNFLPSLCGQIVVMALSCLQQIPPWQKNTTSSLVDAIPLPSSLLFPKRNPELNTGKFFPSSLPKVAASQKRGEKGKSVQINDKFSIMEHSSLVLVLIWKFPHLHK